MNTWKLRDAILAASYRWPLFIAFVLVGGLFGWTIPYINPSPYRATTELFVGLNPYRVPDDRYPAAFGEIVYRNRDDYKNWQMEQLNGLAYFDEVLGSALSTLRAEDAYWVDVPLASLDERLDLFWRSAGIWHLVAVDSDPQRAAALVQAWRDAIYETSNEAIQASQRVYSLDLQIQSVEAEIVEIIARQAELAEIRDSLQGFSQRLGDLQADRELSLNERWELARLAGKAAGFDEEWLAVLDSIPAEGAAVQAYLPWIDRLIVAVDQELEFLPARLEALESRREQRLRLWEDSLAGGHGLASTLTVEIPADEAPEVEIIRQSGVTIAVGAFVGALLWVVLEVVRISRRRTA